MTIRPRSTRPANYNYDHMTHEELVIHCKAYAESIHKMGKLLQRYRIKEKHQHEAKALFHG